jgi:mannitol/fructose-specific phosphotransferase system IIA component (Ntr-type)
VGVSAGVLIANFHTHALFDSLKIDNVMPLLNLVFFALIGANIRLESFAGSQLGLVAAYVAARAVGKIGGTWLGCRWTRQDRKVTACLPLLTLPQAGVAAVEAVYVVTLLGATGQAVADVVLPALVIFEMVGVFLSERSLLKWRGWTVGESEVLSSRDRALRASLGGPGHPFYALAEFVPQGCLGRVLEARSLPDAIEELAVELDDAGAIADPETVVERALAREKMGSTAIENGIVIPHSKAMGQRDTVCAIGLADPPLAEARGPDGIPASTVILLVSPAQRPDAHLRALATIARVFSDDDFRLTFDDAVRQGRADELLRPNDPGA